MFYDKDIPIFFKDFGEVATKDGNDFKVIFDDIYQEISPYSMNKPINSKDLFCSVQNKDISNLYLKAKDIIVIDNIKYVIKNIKFDRVGISEMELQYEDDEEDE